MIMRPFDVDVVEQLRLAGARAEELGAAWRTANGPSYGARPPAGRTRRNPLRLARKAAGRTLVGLGQRVMPAGVEPCA